MRGKPSDNEAVMRGKDFIINESKSAENTLEIRTWHHNTGALTK